VYHANLKQQKGKDVEQLPWGTRVKGHDLMAQIKTETVLAMFDQVVEKESL
jgi:heptosyltransferase I